MTLEQFLENYSGMKPKTVAEKLSKALDRIKAEIENDPDLAVDLLNDGLLTGASDFEANDCFGTEGMRL